MCASIQPSRLYEQIVDQITDLVAMGALISGDRLPSERELAQQFGVSRTAVREAVKVLNQQGLVEIRPGLGSFVTSVADSASEVVRDSLALMVKTDIKAGLDDLQQVRSLLEPGIAALAAESSSEADRRLMESLIDRMDASLDKQDVFVEADLDFHLALAKATQNSLIPVLIDPVIDLLREQRARISAVPGGPERGNYHHRQILAAIKKRDARAARLAMTAHIEQVVQDSQTYKGD